MNSTWFGARVLLVACVALCLAACTDFVKPNTRQTYAFNEGPLDVGKALGSNSVFPPRNHADWTVTFGGTSLCSRDPDKQIVLQGVSIDVDKGSPPLASRAFARIMTKEQLNAAGASRKDRYMGSYGTIGAPPNSVATRPPVPGEHWPGTIAPDIAGIKVTSSCDQVLKTDKSISTGASSPTGMIEVLFVLKVDSRGGSSPRQFINFLEDGHPKRVEVPWRIVACGSSLKKDPVCPPRNSQ